MNEENLSPTEVAVNKYLAAGQSRISDLEYTIKNLPSDKGLHLKPDGGPVSPTKGHQKVALEKEITGVKEETLTLVEHEIKDAPADIKEKCNYKIEKWLHPEAMEAKQAKDLNASQAHITTRMHEKKLSEQPVKPLEKGDRKTPEQSERFMYQKRYGKDMPETDPEPPKLKPGQKDKKDLDASQDYAFNRRYNRDKSDGPSSPTATKSKDVSKGKTSIQPGRE